MNEISTPELSRRSFIKVAAASSGGLMLTVMLPLGGRAALAAAGTVTAYVSIASDETVTIMAPAPEMGQGTMSTLPQIVAEELCVDWSKVKVAQAPAGASYVNPVTGSQLVGGSMSVRGYFQGMLKAGATARQMLVSAAATQLGTSIANCTVANGIVTNTLNGATVTYGAVAAAAALVPVPSDPVILSSTRGYKLVGTSAPRKDIPSKTNGSAIFGIDVRVPGMLYAAVKHSPVLGGTLASTPAKPSGAIAVVPFKNAVGVVAKDTWTAFKALNQLSVSWTRPATAAAMTDATILATANTLMTSGTPRVAETVGSPTAGLAASATLLNMTYTLPYLAHACLEPLNCTVSVTPTSCEIWAPTQAPGMCVQTAATITGLPASAIKVNTVHMGGGLGRKFEQDYIAQAVTISKAMGKPVKLTWPRSEDFRNDQYRPMAVTKITAGLDTYGNPVYWSNRIVSQSILGQRGWLPSGAVDSQAVDGAVGMPYAINNRLVEWVPHTATVPVGFWRSVGHSINAFAVESAIDEIATKLGVNPLAFRRRLMVGNTRGLAVLDRVAALSNWATTPAAGIARGLAYHESFGSIVAQVVEIQRVAATATTAATVKLLRVSAVIDCGLAVNPDNVAAQIQGAVMQGLSAALWDKIGFNSGVPNVSNFNAYPSLRMRQAPRIDVAVISTPGAAIGGVGEPGVPPAAPALANAYAALTGIRLRSLPMSSIMTNMGGGDD